jgi:hypothetical protein
MGDSGEEPRSVTDLKVLAERLCALNPPIKDEEIIYSGLAEAALPLLTAGQWADFERFGGAPFKPENALPVERLVPPPDDLDKIAGALRSAAKNLERSIPLLKADVNWFRLGQPSGTNQEKLLDDLELIEGCADLLGALNRVADLADAADDQHKRPRGHPRFPDALVEAFLRLEKLWLDDLKRPAKHYYPRTEYKKPTSKRISRPAPMTMFIDTALRGLLKIQEGRDISAMVNSLFEGYSRSYSGQIRNRSALS